MFKDQPDRSDLPGVGRTPDHSFGEERVRELMKENEALREELGRELEELRLILDALPAPVAYIDRSHRFRQANRIYATLFNAKGEDLAGAAMSEVIGVDLYNEIGPYLERAFAGEEVDISSSMEIPPLGRRQIRTTIRPDRDDDGRVRGVIMHSVDVTDAGESPEVTGENELRLRRIAESNILGIGFWEGDTIIEANDALLDMLGYSRAELRSGSLSLESITATEFREAHGLARQQMLRGGFSHPYEKELLRRDGSRLPVLFGMGLYEGRTDHGAFFVLDISDKREIENALRDSEQRYRAWVENSSEGIWRFELEQPVSTSLAVDEQLDRFYELGYLAECNVAMARMYGFESPEQIIGARLGDMLVRSDPNNEAYLRRFVLSGYRLADAESIEVDNEGGRKVFLNNLVGIVENGMLVRGWGTQRDVTERKLVEEEVIRAREAAEGASRAKDRFLATLSHELRTPLTPVVAAIDLLQSEEGLPESIASAIEIIGRNVDMEARLIDDLLDLTRISNGKLQLRPETIELTSLIEEVVEICRGDIERRKLHLEISLDPEPMLIDADPSRLQQVFWNLLKNAVKFTPEGGRIWIRSRVNGDRVRVEVGDSGIGIEPEILPRIFDPFEQGALGITRRFGGLGLGLAISRTIVAMHGGTLVAASDGHDRGATFTVSLVRNKSRVLESRVESQ
jgi:PAS domain S-box-containing protein